MLSERQNLTCIPRIASTCCGSAAWKKNEFVVAYNAFRFALVCHEATADLRHRGWNLAKKVDMQEGDKIRQVLQPESLFRGLQLATPQCSATCNISSQEHPINQGLVVACYLQHARCSHRYHPRPRNVKQIFKYAPV